MSAQSLPAFQKATAGFLQRQEAQAKALLIRTAKEGHAELMRTGAVTLITAYANRPGNPIEQVQLPGPIVYHYRQRAHELSAIVAAAIRSLQEASPVVSGTYRDNHWLYVDGAPVTASPDEPAIAAALKDARPGAIVMVANPVPYSRRLEVGVTQSGRAFVVQVPPRIYDRVGKQLQDRYAGVVRITVITSPGVELPDAAGIRGARGRAGVSTHHRSGGRRVRRRGHGGETVLAPALILDMVT